MNKLSGIIFFILLVLLSCQPEEPAIGKPTASPGPAKKVEIKNVTEFKAVPGDKEVTLSWVSAEESYYTIITYSKADLKIINTYRIEKKINTWKISGLTNDIEYTFNVKTMLEDGETTSDTISLKAKPQAKAPVVLPPKPITSLISVPGDKQVSFTWIDSAETETIEISCTPVVENIPLIINKGIQQAVVSGLTNGTEYTFQVVAINFNGRSTVVEAKVTPNVFAVQPVSDVTATPFELSISLSWTNPEGVTSANLVVEPGSINQIVNGNEKTISVSSNTEYSISIYAISGENKSAPVTLKVTTLKSPVVVDIDSGVMLQAFHWDSVVDHKNSWYTHMSSKKDDIKDNFAYVWMPPPSNAGEGPRPGVNEGYVPRQLNDLTSQYGNAAQLRQVIADFAPAKAIADVVINHRTGTASWGDFTNPSWDVDFKSICSDDEIFTNAASPQFGKSHLGGAADSGEKYASFRDLDHTNINVQNGIVTWMNDKLKDLGFVGWRYDYVKGFHGKYVGLYNKNTSAEFSVGEHWPSAGFNPSDSANWKNSLMQWVNQTTENSGVKARVFDFVLKGNLNYAFGYFASNNTEHCEDTYWDMSRLADGNNLMRSNPESAVTFVDNHDTGSTQRHWELDPKDVYLGYVFILTHSGYPSVAWQHFFTGTGTQFRGADIALGTGKNYNEHIKKLIEIRKNNSIKYNSPVVVKSSTAFLYAAEIDGKVAVKIGGEAWTPVGEWSPAYSGTNFAIWTKGALAEGITVTGNGTFGTISSSTDKTLTIKNSGLQALTLGNPAATITGDSVFTVKTQPSKTTLEVNESTTLVINCNPLIDGAYNGELTIKNNSSEILYTTSLSASKGEATGRLTIETTNWTDPSTLYFPGDFNEWNPSSDSIAGVGTLIKENVVTTTVIAKGNSITTMEFKVLNTAGDYDSAWGFASWTLNNGITTAVDGKQILIPCNNGDNIHILINVGANSISIK